MSLCKVCGGEGHYAKTCSAWQVSRTCMESLHNFIINNDKFDLRNGDFIPDTHAIKYWISNISKDTINNLVIRNKRIFNTIMKEWGDKLRQESGERTKKHCRSAIAKFSGMHKTKAKRGRMAGGKSKVVADIQIAVSNAKEVECPFGNKINSNELLLARCYKQIEKLKKCCKKEVDTRNEMAARYVGLEEHMHQESLEHGKMIKKLNGDIRLLKMANKGDDVCTICFDGVDKNTPNTTILGCGHPFHTNCIMEWIVGQNNNACPNCKVPQEGASINDNIKCQWHGVPNCRDCYHAAMIQYEIQLDEEATQELVDEEWVPPPAAQIIPYESGDELTDDDMPGLEEAVALEEEDIANSESSEIFINSPRSIVRTTISSTSPNTVYYSYIHMDGSMRAGIASGTSNRLPSMLTFSQDSLDNAGIVNNNSMNV